MSLRGFSKRADIVGKRIVDNAGVVVRRCALAVDGSVVLATPVDTGRARSNWIVSTGSPESGERDTYGAGAAQAAIEQGKRAVQGYKGEGDAIYITNNLKYIERLNEGWSAQAPAAFVQTAILNGVQTIKDSKLASVTLKSE